MFRRDIGYFRSLKTKKSEDWHEINRIFAHSFVCFDFCGPTDHQYGKYEQTHGRITSTTYGESSYLTLASACSSISVITLLKCGIVLATFVITSKRRKRKYSLIIDFKQLLSNHLLRVIIAKHSMLVYYFRWIPAREMRLENKTQTNLSNRQLTDDDDSILR